MATVRLLFAVGMLRVSPPWLRRLIGGAIMRSLGVPVDTQVDRTVDGMELRFPDALQPDALGLLGRERRILRGPGEDAATFAGRLRAWWDAHRARGGPYELLRQMHAFFLATNNVPIQYIANSGTSVTIDAAGVLTRSVIAGWTGDGEYPTKWARFFVVLSLSGTTVSIPLVTESGEPIVTESGEAIVIETSIYALTSDDTDLLCSVPREWSAAHIDQIYLVLIPTGGLAWGLPAGTLWGDPGLTWGGSSDSVLITC